MARKVSKHPLYCFLQSDYLVIEKESNFGALYGTHFFKHVMIRKEFELGRWYQVSKFALLLKFI